MFLDRHRINDLAHLGYGTLANGSSHAFLISNATSPIWHFAGAAATAMLTL